MTDATQTPSILQRTSPQEKKLQVEKKPVANKPRSQTRRNKRSKFVYLKNGSMMKKHYLCGYSSNFYDCKNKINYNHCDYIHYADSRTLCGTYVSLRLVKHISNVTVILNLKACILYKELNDPNYKNCYVAKVFLNQDQSKYSLKQILGVFANDVHCLSVSSLEKPNDAYQDNQIFIHREDIVYVLFPKSKRNKQEEKKNKKNE